MKILKQSKISKMVTIALSFTLTASLWADDKEIKFIGLPANIQTAASALLKGAKVTEVEIEKEDGNIEYEIEFIKDKRETCIKLDAAGKLLETETEIKLKDAPTPVQATIKKAMGAKGELEEIEKVVMNGVITYEAKIKIGEKEMELLIDPSGKILKKKVEDEDDDDDDDDDEDEDDDDE